MKIQKSAMVEAALVLLNQEGLEGLTMRRLASVLNVKAASLYWHIPHKRALLEMLSDQMMANVAVRDLSALQPKDKMRAVFQEMRAVLLSYRDGATVFAGTYVVTPNIMRISEVILSACEALNRQRKKTLPSQRLMNLVFSFLYFLLGLVQEEQSFYQLNQDEKALSSLQAQLAQLDLSLYPTLFKYRANLLEINFDERFELGIEALMSELIEDF